jgi:hypothetical protein
MFKRVFIITKKASVLTEYEDEKSMESDPPILPIYIPSEFGLNIVKEVQEYENDKLLRSYEYSDPTRSEEMARISEEKAPHSVISRVNSIFTPDNWYRNIQHDGLFDAVACEVLYRSTVHKNLGLKIYFGFIRIRESSRSNDSVWIFVSIFMLSNISGKMKTFGCNSFQDSDFRSLASSIKSDNFMNLVNIGNDDAIAKSLKIELGNYTNIFSLCNDARKRQLPNK